METDSSQTTIPNLLRNTPATVNSTMQPADNTSHISDTWSDKVITQVTITVVVMVMTLIGNTVLILTLVCSKTRRRRRLSVFLINLALGDLTVCVVTMSTEIIFVAFGGWVLGPVACKLTVYGQIVTLASSTFVLTAMSIDRYQVIVRPLYTLAHRPKIWKKVAYAWGLALIFATPQLFIFVEVRVENSDGDYVYKCVSRGYTNPEWQRKVYMTFLASYVLLIPTIIMSYCYIKIIQTLWNRGSTAAESTNTVEIRMSGRADLVSNSKRKAVKLSLVVIFCFLICWTPYFVVSLIRIYSNYTIHLDTLLDFSEKMALVHSALNPLIYGAFNVQFKRISPCLKSMRTSFTKCCQRSDTATDEDADEALVNNHTAMSTSLNQAHKPIHYKSNIEMTEHLYNPPNLVISASGNNVALSDQVSQSTEPLVVKTQTESENQSMMLNHGMCEIMPEPNR